MGRSKITREGELFMISLWEIIMHITQIKGHTDGSSLLMDIKCCLVGINVEFSRPSLIMVV